MKNKKIIFTVVVILLVLSGLSLLYFLNRDNISENDTSVTIIPIGNADLIEAHKTNRGLSRINNKTSNYSVDIPNTWTIENQSSYQAFLSEETLGKPDSCLLSVALFPSNGMTAEYFVDRNVEISSSSERMVNDGRKMVQQEEGVLQIEYFNDDLVSEGVYLERGDKIYVISGYYGGKIPSEYDSCHPLFEEFLNSFEFTD